MQKNPDFTNLYNKSCRLAAAVFMISNVMDENEELRTKIKKLSLDLVSMSVNLKDIAYTDAKKLIGDIEKNSLELISMLDIASLSGLISPMNGKILKEEFQSFIGEMNKFSEKFRDQENGSVKNILGESFVPAGENSDSSVKLIDSKPFAQKEYQKVPEKVKETSNNNGYRRKDLRKNTIFNFVKGHNNVSIKDIVPNIVGCSEKTIQRELIELISEGKLKKVGERRWSRYSVA